MKSTLSSFLLSGLLVSVCATALPAQAPAAAPSNSQQTPVYQATAEEVVLDVVARDKKGKPVNDLTASDFKVEDNGTDQKITAVRLVEGGEAVERGTHVPLDAMRQIRLVTLVFERLSDAGRRIARKAAQDLVQSEQAPNVFFSVVTIDNQLFVLRQFSTDKTALKKAIELATSGKYSSYAAESERIKAELHQAAGQTGADQAPAGAALAGSAYVQKRVAQIMLGMLQFEGSFSRDESTRTSIFALLSLVRGQVSLPGRKTILYFSEGMSVPTNLDEPFSNITSTANRTNVAIYSVDCRGVMTESQNTAATDALNAATKDIAADTTAGSIRDNMVTKDQIRASDRAEDSIRGNLKLPLITLAESTGGFLIGEANDLRPALRQVSEEVSNYYEITYNPGIKNYDGRFRKTKVESLRKDIVLHARNGYFALPMNIRGPAVLPYEFTLLKAMDTTPVPTAVDFRSGIMRLKDKDLVIVEVPMSGIQFTEDAAAKLFKSRISLVAVVKNDKGEVVSKLSYDLPRNGPLQLMPQARAGNLIYKEQVEVPPGKYTLETGVIDHEANKIGVEKSPFTVDPKHPGVAMSSLCLVRNYQPGVKDLDVNDPLQFQGGRITPTLAGKVFAVKGAQLSTFFVVYPDPAIKAAPTANIEFLVEGAPVAKADLPLPAPDALGRINYVMSAPAESLPAMTYEIHVTVKQGSTTADERMKVAVESR